MTHSKFFLVLTTVCLAVAGIVAAKAKSADHATIFYNTSIAQKCVKCPLLLGITYCITGEQYILRLCTQNQFQVSTQPNAIYHLQSVQSKSV